MESRAGKGRNKVAKPVFAGEKCKSCEMCVSVCPPKILSLSRAINGRGYNIIQCDDEARCVGCASCARICPDAVIEIYK